MRDLKPNKIPHTREIYGAILTELKKVNKDIVVIEADLMKAAGTGVFAEKFPTSSFQIGIAEQNLIGIAAGLAAVGKIPFANAFASFVSRRACDQIALSVAFPKFNVKIVGIYAGFTTEYLGPTHHAFNDIAIIRSLPNIVILSPADAQELKEIIKFSVKYKGPIYLRLGYGDLPSINSASYKFLFGRGVIIQEGGHATIISTGIMVSKVCQAAHLLKEKGINVQVINIHTIKPIDKALIIKTLKKTKLLVTVEDHSTIGGLGSIISEIISEEGANCRLIRMGIEDDFGSTGSFDWLIKRYKIDVPDIVQTIEKALR